MKNFIFYTDEQLIKLVADKLLNRGKVSNYFYKKYLYRFRFISSSLIKKFYNSVMEVNDLISFGNDAIEYSIDIYIEQYSLIKYKFVQILIRKYKFMVLDYLKKHITQKHMVLNGSSSLNNVENSISNNNYYDIYNLIYSNLLIKKIFSSSFKLNLFEKLILKFREIGYKNREISIMLGISTKKIDNVLQKSKRKILAKLHN